jgi:hypothetical protein
MTDCIPDSTPQARFQFAEADVIGDGPAGAFVVASERDGIADPYFAQSDLPPSQGAHGPAYVSASRSV